MSAEENGPQYIIMVGFTTFAAFLVWLGYKLLVPVYYLAVSPLAGLYPSLVHDNPTYVDAFGNLMVQNNTIYQYSFFVLMGGICVVFVLAFAYRRQNTSDFLGEEEF